MCGRFVQVQKIEIIEKRFNLDKTPDIDYEPNYNVSPGDKAAVITNDKPKQLQMFDFGLTPSWAKKKMYLINARSEGDNNKENDTSFDGEKGIINKPAFSKPIRSQRCLVVADAFYEGPQTDKLNKPYVVYLRDKQRPFAFAGIWDTYKDQDGKEINSFAIITTVANSLMQQIGHPRTPVILYPGQEALWLNGNASLSEITNILTPYNADLMNAYRVSSKMKDAKLNTKDLVNPIEQRINPEYEMRISDSTEKNGFGRSYKKSYKTSEKPPIIIEKKLPQQGKFFDDDMK